MTSRIAVIIVALALGTGSMSPTRPSEGLALSIRTEKSSFAVGERVVVEVRLHNTGSTVITVLKYFMLPADNPDKNTLEVQVSDAGGKRLSRVSHMLTGRALYYPQTRSIDPGDTYGDPVPIAGTFTRTISGTEVTQAVWCLGEDPEAASFNEYPPMTPGKFTLRVAYRVTENHLVNLREPERAAIWTGQLISNSLEISVE